MFQTRFYFHWYYGTEYERWPLIMVNIPNQTYENNISTQLYVLLNVFKHLRLFSKYTKLQYILHHTWAYKHLRLLWSNFTVSDRPHQKIFLSLRQKFLHSLIVTNNFSFTGVHRSSSLVQEQWWTKDYEEFILIVIHKMTWHGLTKYLTRTSDLGPQAPASDIINTAGNGVMKIPG